MKDNSRREQLCLQGARLFLILLFFAWVGWIWEVVHVSMLAGHKVDRGFLFSPICPIYGVTMVIAYLLIGTPEWPGGILKYTRGKWYRFPLYALAAIILPTLVELIVGCGCELLFDLRLWDYSHYSVTVNDQTIPLHFRGYIALPISLIWLLLLFSVMTFVFPALLRLTEKIPARRTKRLALISGAVVAVDLIASSIAASL